MTVSAHQIQHRLQKHYETERLTADQSNCSTAAPTAVALYMDMIVQKRGRFLHPKPSINYLEEKSD